MMPQSERNIVVKFSDELRRVASARQKYEDLRSFIKYAVEQKVANPVYDEVKRALIDPSLAIIVGARGSGKTTLLALASYDLADRGFSPHYITPDAQLDCTKVMQNKNVALLLDDFADYSEALLKNLKTCFEKLEENPSAHRIIIATQSERKPVASLGEIIDLLKRPWMFFEGESPDELKRKIIEYISSGLYASERPFRQFRAASVISLDAFWARYRSLERFNDLIALLRKMTIFYATSAFKDPTTINRVLNAASGVFDVVAVAILAHPPVIKSEASYVFILETTGEPNPLEGLPTYPLNGQGIVLALADMLLSAHDDEKRIQIKTYINTVNQIKNLKEQQITSSELVRGIFTALSYYRMTRALPIDFSENYPVEKICGQLQHNVEKKRRRGPESGVIILRREMERPYFILLQHAGETSNGKLSGYQCKKLELLSKCASVADKTFLYIVSVNSQVNIKRCLDISKLESGIELLYADGLQNSREGALIHVLEEAQQDEGVKRLLARIFLNNALLRIRDGYHIPKLAVAILGGRVI